MTTGWKGTLFESVATSAPMDPDKATKGLNAAQREAVLHGDGPALVLAGAGSGKTRVLTTRIARLIGNEGVPAHRILAVTFTNKAAGEMRSRIAALLGHEPRGMWCGTFHALGARMLRSSAEAVDRSPNFTIYDQDDTLALIKRIVAQRRLDPKQFPPNSIQAAISSAKNALIIPSQYSSSSRDTFSTAVAGVYTDLELALRQANAVTFDDLLVLPVRVLESDAARREELQRRFSYVLVDEYQDTNAAQYRFVQIVGAAHHNVMVVGDDDQSIYGWRGADIRNILDFERDFTGAKVIRLEENYRSTPNVLALANAVIAQNAERRGKTMRATRPAGETVTLVEALDERDEADFIADTVMERVLRSHAEYRSHAVLYRTNAQSRAIEDAFRKRGIPHRLVGAVRFYDRREIRDLMAYLRLVANPSDDEAFRRAVNTPRRGLGDSVMASLAEHSARSRRPLLEVAADPALLAELRPAARKSLSEFCSLIAELGKMAVDAAVDELLREVVDRVRYTEHLRSEGPEGLDRIDNVRELIAGAAEVVLDEGGEVGLSPLDSFLQSSTLVTGIDRLDPDADAVTCMTMHNAKGLEFPVVFVTGLEDGLFPLSRAAEDPSQLEEERRLFYVGITRAEEKLYLSCAGQRRRNGEMMYSPPSRFLNVITPELAERRQTARARSEGRRSSWNLGHRGSGDWGNSGPDSGRSGSGHFGSGPSRTLASPARHKFSHAAPRFEPEDESQDTPMFRVGERVHHHKFGSGRIAELTGSGRDAKVRIDFDDEEIGRKTLVIAQARLERGLD